jgi:hypothetical protein
MSYKLYTDKLNKFQCSIQVEGTSLERSQARVILETNDQMSYLFKGKIFDNGVCEFELPKLKGILSEGTIGLLKLEIIADDVHFEPWNSEFSVQADKKVNVVVQEQQVSEKPRIVMNEITLTRVEEPKKVVETKRTTEPAKVVSESRPQPVRKQPQPIIDKDDSKPFLTKEEIMRKFVRK